MKTTKGLLAILDFDLIIKEVIYNDILPEGIVGRPLFELMIAEDQIKLKRFARSIAGGNSEFNWDVSLRADRSIRTLVLSGTKHGDQFIMVGAYDNQQMMIVLDELLKLNNEQVNVYRSAIKQMYQTNQSTARDESETWDEMTQLNNELATLQREISKKNIELQKLSDLKTRFLGMAAHDLRNPLASVMSYTEFLLDEIASELAPEYQGMLQTIHNSTMYMHSLVEELLDVSIIEQGQLLLTRQPVDLSELILNCVSLNTALAMPKNIEIRYAVPEPGQVVLNLDGPKIEQVINNLLSNAVKFTQPGGRVDVKIEQIKETVQVSVQDTGVGIPEDEIDDLFKMFSRASSKSTAGESSTGLGLAIAKNIIDAHGGTISVKSNLGVGSTFIIQFPNDL